MATPSQISFGSLLKRHRGAAGLSQEELAGRAGVGVRTISDLERDVARWPYQSTVTLLAEALQLDAAQREELDAAARRPTDAHDQPVQAPLATPDLPGYLTPLLGRERDEVAVGHLLQRHDVRL